MQMVIGKLKSVSSRAGNTLVMVWKKQAAQKKEYYLSDFIEKYKKSLKKQSVKKKFK